MLYRICVALMNSINPCTLFKCLADETRLKSVLLIALDTEACVCDLMTALELDQAKISRHLAQLRKCGILLDERRGRWVFYKVHPMLPAWAKEIIDNAARNNDEYIQLSLKRLIASKSSAASCC